MKYMVIVDRCSDCTSGTIAKLFDHEPTREEQEEVDKEVGFSCTTVKVLIFDEDKNYYVEVET